MIGLDAVQQALGRWWLNYDAGHLDLLGELLAHDAHFTCRSDTGATDYEDFIRADVRGHDEVLAWQTQHRRASPHPLRHNCTNVHLTGGGGDEATFAAYLLVTHIVDGAVANLSTAVCTGTVRAEGEAVRLAGLHVVLDTMTSEPFAARTQR